ncbi:Endoribonuclease L-PSP family protein [Coccidioides posadasii C735 delta SOWgp]|nr:Endoribonuclease L-PSP family protein [Coccidioides posadasii C735 delta SOWgp]EER26851.1 Endoribonuclease L-PSP family protein [Coccidioides posadasii C735 delta SOWgp]KMM72432.1 HMF1 protein [Coccidioides posadasii RMSCC 3488]|eukprot:XP_003068996.1 Endoribonuclease L-PSP family protein [Coccidioides posadasii C735 delta SOWgp]
MAEKRAVFTEKGVPPLPVLSQAVVHNGMIYCSGSLGLDPATKEMVSGGVGQRTAQALQNLKVVLEAGGSSVKNVVKANVFLTSMKDFVEMNKAYESFFADGVKPCRTCVAVKELPFGTDVEIECIAYL